MIQENVATAFSKQSTQFDQIEEENEILKFMRERIHRRALKHLKKGDYLLELNCGTGIDATFFAMNGIRVKATDVASGMIEQTKKKTEKFNLQNMISAEQCSYTALNKLNEGPFDAVFSDFGGLNCVSDLSEVVTGIKSKLKKGGKVILVIMPPICPWEIALALKGSFKTAFRRLKKSGAESHVEGEHFTSWYFTPSQVAKAFGPEFKIEALEGLGSLVPPPYLENFPKKFPRLFKALGKMEEKVSTLSPFNRWCDHFIIVFNSAF